MASFGGLQDTLLSDSYEAVWDCLEKDPSQAATPSSEGGFPATTSPALEFAQQHSCMNSALAVEEFIGSSSLHKEHTSASLKDCRRFLRARQGDVTKASAFLGADVSWRSTFKPEAVSQDDLKIALPTGAWRILGTSADGFPVVLISTALWQPHLYSVEEYAKYVAYFCEGMVKVGGEGARFVILFDMAGWKFSHALQLKKVAKLVDTVQNHYPERLEVAYLFRAPRIFGASWNIIKGWVDPNTAKKVKFIKVDQEKASFVDAKIPLDIVPPAYEGGARAAECPVPNIPGEPDVAVKCG